MNVHIISGDAIECVLPYAAIVGESPVWHPGQQRLYWIDIQGKQIHRFDPASRENESFPLPEIVTCIQLRSSGGLVLTLKKNFAFFDPESQHLDRLQGVEGDLPDNRFNDGKCDPQGRFWAGTMNAKHWDKPSGSLYRMERNLKLKKMQSQVICSNGSGWSPDGHTMYYTESFRYGIFAYNFDPATGNIENRRLFAEIDSEARKAGGFPDGMTVDAEGFVWSNQVGVGKIVRYDPAGKIERIIDLPVPRATDCTFGGSNLETLYITSARETMTLAELKEAPLSGSLFAIETGIKGQPSTPFEA
ncbi:MAG: SMP-30/gluconolactonase/LRE family protein [Acidobacteriaceae bacterium]